MTTTFRTLGYLWALQKHLSEIRKQIQNPSESILTYRYSYSCNGDPFEKPWVGIANINEQIFLVAGIFDRIVILPSADMPSPETPDFSKPSKASYRKLNFYEGSGYGEPIGVMYKDRILVMPDLMLKGYDEGTFLFYESWEASPVAMRKISDEHYQELSKLPNAVKIMAKKQLHTPENETARDASHEE